MLPTPETRIRGSERPPAGPRPGFSMEHAANGAASTRILASNPLMSMLIQKREFTSARAMCFLWMAACVSLTSWNSQTKPMTGAAVATIPKSSGVSRRDDEGDKLAGKPDTLSAAGHQRPALY